MNIWNNNEGRSKSAFVSLMVLITVGCIIYGCYNNMKSSGIPITKIFHFDNQNEEKNMTKVSEGEVTVLASFSKLTVDGDLMELIVKAGENYSISYEGNEELRPSAKLENEELKIVQNVSIKITDDKTCRVVITVPSGTTLKNVDLGVDLGNILLSELCLDELNIAADCGNVEIEKLTIDQDMTIAADLGNVELTDVVCNHANLVAECGSISAKQMKAAYLVAENDLGNIALEGDFEELTAHCSLGSVALNTGSIDNSKLSLKTDLGSVSVNGVDKGNSFEK